MVRNWIILSASLAVPGITTDNSSAERRPSGASGLSILPRDGDTIDYGFQTSPEISHHWGQYSPFFGVPSDISSDTPENCRITFAQVLARHGARFPTASKTATYASLIAGLKANVTSYKGDYAFLSTYNYTLGADSLTTFGQQEMINAGIKFYERYQGLTNHLTPFVRASSQDRVVQSAQNFTQGFHSAKALDRTITAGDPYPYPILVLLESPTSNNTLNHAICTAFESNTNYTNIASNAQKLFLTAFAPPITTRLNNSLPGAKLKDADVISLMDLCPFNTVATLNGTLSPFCNLFTSSEWLSYDYYNSLGKYYGYGAGNPLGPTQGVGFTNELISRLTNTAVQDRTSTNSTLDSNRQTFPIGSGQVLFADFSHDDDLTSIFFALGLYNSTTTLNTTSVETIDQSKGYSAAWTVPFAARAYVEKLNCSGTDEELVRVLVNNRVIPLEAFGANSRGLVPLSKFVAGLSFARGNGFWSKCFV